MSPSPTARGPSDVFARPTSAILCGANRSLLNWVAYGLAASEGREFVWTNVELDGEVMEDSDLLSKDLIPRDRFLTVRPNTLVRDEFAGNVALGGLVRTDEPTEAIRRFADFLRLPLHTQAVISRLPRTGPPVVLVLSNVQRMAALYPTEAVAPTVRSIVESGASLLLTWADAPSKGRFAFENVLHLRGSEPSAWREAVLRVEQASPDGPLRAGDELCLGDFAPVASTLTKVL